MLGGVPVNKTDPSSSLSLQFPGDAPALSGKTVDVAGTRETHPIQEHSEWGHSPEEITCDQGLKVRQE